jgi:hypothetical protein
MTTTTLTQQTTTATTTTPVLTARQRIDEMAAELWAWPHEEITKLIKCRVPKFKFRLDLLAHVKKHNSGSRWWVVDQLGCAEISPAGAAKIIPASELPDCLVLDIESTKEHNRINITTDEPDYQPFLAVAYGMPAGSDLPCWYVWVGQPDHSDRLIEMPKDKIIIGFNSATHDSKFLSCEYEGLALPIIHVDVMSLLTMYRGICDDKQQAAYAKYLAAQGQGKAAPEWFAHVTRAGLADAARNILGIPIVKGIDPKDPEAPQNVIEYCAQDTSLTVQLLQHIYPILYKRFISSPATWVGMAASAGLAIWLDDKWDEHCNAMAIAAAAARKATGKAWLSYHQHQYAELYINDGAAKVGINPVGDPISRFPGSGVWCHKHSQYLPAFTASQESGYCYDVHLVVPDGLSAAVKGDPEPDARSPLLGVLSPESIRFESDKRKAELLAQFNSQSIATDLLHAALTVINWEIGERGIDARVCDFHRTADDIRIGVMGAHDDADTIRAICDQAQELVYELANQVAAAWGVPF